MPVTESSDPRYTLSTEEKSGMRVSIFTGLGEPSIEIILKQFVQALLKIAGDRFQIKIYRPSQPLRKRLGDTPIGRLAFYFEIGFMYGIFARRKQGDINHVIDNRYAHLVHFLDAERTVVTSHGGTPQSFHRILGAPYRIQLRFFEWATRGMLSAHTIFIVSQYSKKELLQDYRVDPSKVIVLYPGVAPYFHPPSSQQRELARSSLGVDSKTFVLLHVGHSGPRKNVEVILKALPFLSKHVKNSLVFLHVGQDFTLTQKHLIRELSIEGMVRAIPFIQHNSLPRIYHAADLFVFPSWYEGFGMPIAEAMASAVPTICSDYELFHEVAGDAALFFSTHDPRSLANVAADVLNSPQLSQRLIDKGLTRASQFSWENYARQVADVYSRISR